MDESEDLVARERTYHAFNMLIRWSMVLLGSGILWLTLWFATPAGFWGGTLIGAVAFVVGYYFVIRHEAHQPLDPWVMGR
jgi:F0F1-type ATP synthase assembly protein I